VGAMIIKSGELNKLHSRVKSQHKTTNDLREHREEERQKHLTH
jgi:hypothetical protein